MEPPRRYAPRVLICLRRNGRRVRRARVPGPSIVHTERMETDSGSSVPSRILFICTGNYYRSRFAEILFNSLTVEAELRWTAFSRGTAADQSLGNIGPISSHTVMGLEARGIVTDGTARFPEQLEELDLESADHIVALNEWEHREPLERLHPRWSGKVEYWQVDDLGFADPVDALAKIDAEVRRLIELLSRR